MIFFKNFFGESPINAKYLPIFFIDWMPIQMKDDNDTMPHSVEELVPELDRAENVCDSKSILF